MTAEAVLPASFLTRLRVQTRPAHILIEQVPALARLMTPGLDRQAYADVLHNLHRFHAGLHGPLATALAALPAAARFADATRLTALGQDLVQLGAGIGAPAVPACLPVLPTAAHGLGCLYVIEGSTLGGRVIARRLEDALALDTTNGAAFYGGRTAAEVRTRFKALVTLLEDAACNDNDADAIVAAAIATFACLADFMARPAYFSTKAFSMT